MSGAFPIRKSFLWIFLVANALLFVVYRFEKDSLRIGMPASSSELPVLATLEPFSLTRESGKPFISQELSGAPWVANFIFTRCPNQCPLMTARLATLQRSIPSRVRLVSFSVDPLYDTPDVLKSYALKFGADPGRWAFLTGDREVLRRVRANFKLGESEDPSLHSLRYVLVDDEGRVRGYYDSEDNDSLKKLIEDVGKVAKDHE
jgi:protein SCO1/2